MAPAPVFLPGIGGDASFWDPIRDRLAELSTRALDWPWHAVSGWDALVGRVVAEIDRPGAVIGQSIGGYVAARVALAAPELVTHLVLAVTSAGLDLTTAADWRPATRTAHPNLPAWAFEPPPDLTPALATITVPTLLVWADRDPISPLAVGHRLAELLPRSALVTYPSDDHWVVREFAADVARRIADLVAFRLAGPADADALTELERQANLVALAHVFPPDQYPFPTDGVRARWCEVLADPQVTTVVIDGEHGLDAFVAFDRATLRHLAVHPDRWRTGLARRAIEFATTRMDSPRLWCLRANTRALGAYGHLGWHATGRTRNAEWPPFPEEIELTLLTPGGPPTLTP